MRMLKFKLRRKTLNQIYISYLRPIIEYASIVWDNCTIYEQDKLDKIQYEAARIVTGLTRSVSLERLIKEIGWLSLTERRSMQKLMFVFKHQQGQLPSYINEIFPNSVLDNSTYNLRNNADYATVVRRLEIYSKSTLPASIKMWNDLDLDTRNTPTFSLFKTKLKQMFKPQIVPPYFLHGDRFLQIHHARLRNRCSNLNSDLFYNHLRDNASCNCGHPNEDVEHFLFRCPIYSNQRLILFNNTRPYHP